MRKVGGYNDWLALCEDAHAYELVECVLSGEADAARIQALKAKHGG